MAKVPLLILTVIVFLMVSTLTALKFINISQFTLVGDFLAQRSSTPAEEIVSPSPSVLSTPSPLIAPSPIPSPSPSPFLQSSPVPKTSPKSAPKVDPSSVPLFNDQRSYLMNEINKHRSANGKAAIQTHDSVCSFAKFRADQITTNFSHSGFRENISKFLPSFSYANENIASNSNYTRVVPAWIKSPGHNTNLLADVPYACVESNDRYYVYIAWRP